MFRLLLEKIYNLIYILINSLVDSICWCINYSKNCLLKIISTQKKQNQKPTLFYINGSSPESVIQSLFTPIDDAIIEIETRLQDAALHERVMQYLNNDIPEHFSHPEPIFYLSRHIATPSFEVLHVMEQTHEKPYKLVIGQDTKGIFVAKNELKLALGKLPIVKGVSSNKDEIIENFTIVDFASQQGKRFCDIETAFGEKLVDFHHSIFKEVFPEIPEIYDESDWIDRNHRDDISEQYKKMLALLCVHGIMFESYTPAEWNFVQKIVTPAFAEIEKELHVRPLIIEHIPQDLEYTKNWNAYPSALYQIVKQKTHPLSQSYSH